MLVKGVLMHSVGVLDAELAVFNRAFTEPLKMKSLMENVVPPALAPQTYNLKTIFDVIFCRDAADKERVAPVVEVLVAMLEP